MCILLHQNILNIFCIHINLHRSLSPFGYLTVLCWFWFKLLSCLHPCYHVSVVFCFLRERVAMFLFVYCFFQCWLITKVISFVVTTLNVRVCANQRVLTFYIFFTRGETFWTWCRKEYTTVENVAHIRRLAPLCNCKRCFER